MGSTLSRAALLLLAAIETSGAIQAQDQPPREITVFAAASLYDAFQRLGADFRAGNPGVAITYNFAGSQQLLQQLQHGAHADLFASANFRQMEGAVASGLIDSTSVHVFARNQLVIVLPRQRSALLENLRDLSRPGLKIVLADKSVPAGEYALEFLDRCDRTSGFDQAFKASVLANVASYEDNVRAVLSKVMLGEADAGVVYTSDAAAEARRGIRTVAIPPSVNVTATYPIGRLKESKNAELAERYIAFLLSDAAQTILEHFGFIRREIPPTERR